MKFHLVDTMDEVLQIALEGPLPEVVPPTELPFAVPAPPAAHQQQ
jgi:hypothetical protein